MTRSTHTTIDSILQSKRFGEDAFSEAQRELIRAFSQHPASAWTKQNAPQQEGSTRPRKRTRFAASRPAPLEPHTYPSASSALILSPITAPPSTTDFPTTGSPSTAASPSTTTSHCTTASASSSSSPPPEASNPAPPLRSISLEATANTAGLAHSRPQRIERPPPYPSQQELDSSKPFSGPRIKEEGLVASYSSVDDIGVFVKSVLDFSTQENHFAFLQGTTHDITVFSLFITAGDHERMSKAAGKIAATVFVSLYPSQQLSDNAIQVLHNHSGKSEKVIRRLFKDCRRLGRACQYVRKFMGPGAILLLDNFSACGTKVLGSQDNAVLLRCRETLAATTDFVEQEGRLREPTEMLLSTIISGAAWRSNVFSTGLQCSPRVTLPFQGLLPGLLSPYHQPVQSKEYSTVSEEDTDIYSGLPSWQFTAVPAAEAATEDEQAAFNRSTCLLLTLWCFLGDSPICADAFQRGGKAQDRWTTAGELEGLQPEQVGINDKISGLLRNTKRLDAIVQALISSGSLILAESTCDGLPAYTIESHIKGQIIDSLSHKAKVLWKMQALMLVTFVFPRPNISLEFRTWGPHLLPHLRHTLQEIPSPNTLKDISNDGLFPLTARTDLCLALLAASELPGKWKDEALRNVRFFSKGADDVFIELSATFRESTRMRVKRNTSGSRTLLGTAIKPLAEDQQRSRPLNAVLGSLKVSEALNFVQDENLDAAISQLKSWEPLDPRNPSTMERVVLVNVQFQLAKVLRYQGRFDEAHHHLKNPRKETMEGCLVCEIRTDVANEMGIVLTEMNRPVDAKRILQSEIDTLDRKGRTDTAASKSLHLSIAETFMRQGQTEAANDYYLRLSKLGPFADLCHSVGLARVAHSRLEWSKAIEYWTSALGILTDHFPRGDSHSGYTSLGILQSMHVALSESGHEEYSHRTLRQIRVIEAACAPNGCKHWIPGLNSYWMDSISGSIVRQSASL